MKKILTNAWQDYVSPLFNKTLEKIQRDPTSYEAVSERDSSGDMLDTVYAKMVQMGVPSKKPGFYLHPAGGPCTDYPVVVQLTKENVAEFV